MARRIQIEEDDVSLFPFLSIIAAVIGVLTLMIAAVTLGQMNQTDVKDAVANAIAMDRLQKELATLDDTVEDLSLQLEKNKSEMLAETRQRQNELVKTRAELEALLAELAGAKQRIQELKKIKIVIPEVPEDSRETLADLESQYDVIRKRLAVLKEQVEKKSNASDEAQVSILPGGTGLSFTPHFIECTAKTIVLHDEAEPTTIRKEAIVAAPRFVSLLEKVANQNNHSVVFLLRNDSLATYRMVKGICDKHGVRNGKLPAIGNGRLDFSHFRKK